jgi:ferredoxin
VRGSARLCVRCERCAFTCGTGAPSAFFRLFPAALVAISFFYASEAVKTLFAFFALR